MNTSFLRIGVGGLDIHLGTSPFQETEGLVEGHLKLDKDLGTCALET